MLISHIDFAQSAALPLLGLLAISLKEKMSRSEKRQKGLLEFIAAQSLACPQLALGIAIHLKLSERLDLVKRRVLSEISLFPRE